MAYVVPKIFQIKKEAAIIDLLVGVLQLMTEELASDLAGWFGKKDSAAYDDAGAMNALHPIDIKMEEKVLADYSTDLGLNYATFLGRQAGHLKIPLLSRFTSA